MDISRKQTQKAPLLMHLPVLLLILTLMGSLTARPAGPGISHDTWDALLQAHVSATGAVDYRGFQADRERLDGYLTHLAAHPPQASWSAAARMAYWINAYNAFTVQLILDHYPLKSIRDLDEPWDRKFIQLGGKAYSLNDIEHQILRKEFSDARIHFAVNCASASCPPLLNRAFTAEKLETQLNAQARRFINGTAYNHLGKRPLGLSEIFNWYGSDFTREAETLIAYLNRYAPEPIPAGTEIRFLPYDWRLNDAPKQ